jgi:hypothetical protein
MWLRCKFARGLSLFNQNVSFGLYANLQSYWTPDNAGEKMRYRTECYAGRPFTLRPSVQP